MATHDNNETQQRGLSLGLRQGTTPGHDIFQLHRPSLDARNNLEVTTFEPDRPVALFCRGLLLDEKAGGRLDVAAALRAGLLELVDQETQTVVDFPHNQPVAVGRRDVPPKPSPRHAQLRAGLAVDSTARVWKDAGLRAGRTYVLRFAADADAGDDTVWCRYTDDEEDSAEKKHHRRLPVALERDTSVRFAVHADPASPALAAVFGVSPASCHLSGTPPFKFVVELTLSSSTSSPSSEGKGEEGEKQPVTLCTQRTPFGACLPVGGGLNSVEQLVRCVDADTGEEPEWPAAFQCFDSDPWGAFPADEQFVEVVPGGKPWRVEYTLEREGGGAVGGLEMLEGGARYRAELSEEAKSGFGVWMYGRKEELLAGTVEERKRRWEAGPRGRAPVRVEQVNGPVVFDVVD